jgi:hypothetical protein
MRSGDHRDHTFRSLYESLPSHRWKGIQPWLLRMATFRGQRRSQRMHSKPPALYAAVILTTFARRFTNFSGLLSLAPS